MTLAKKGANEVKQSTAVVVISLSTAVKFNVHFPESFGVLLLKKGASGAGARKGTNGFGEPLGESSGMGMRPLGGSSGMRPPSFSPAWTIR
jgi:hypothetical protein